MLDQVGSLKGVEADIENYYQLNVRNQADAENLTDLVKTIEYHDKF